MEGLQARLDAAFGALTQPKQGQPAWRPSQEQVFRTGAGIQDDGASSDEEYEEKMRRESVPGALSSLL